MKNSLGVLLTVLSMAFLLPSSVFAAKGDIHGTVKYADNTLVTNTTVTVVCNGVTLAPSTNTSGVYLAAFGNACNKDKAYSVSVLGVTVNGTVQDNGTPGQTVNVTVPISTQVPEFGLITGAVAAVGAMGAYLKLRKRQG